MMQIPPIPEGKNCLIPHLVVKDGDKALSFYKEAFKAEEMHCMKAPNGKIMHAALRISGQVLYVCDEMKNGPKAPRKANKTSPMMLHLYVGDADLVFERALELGAKEVMPLSDTFWGERYGQIQDPSGHFWSISTQIEMLTAEQMGERAKEWMAANK